MDPVTAIGLASSVVQFIQFGSSLTSQANRIYKSAEGQLPEHIECTDSSKRLEELSDKVRSSMQEARSKGSRPSASDEAVQDICDGCIEVSGELQKILGKLRIENDSESRTRRKWKSFREALRSVWSIHDIERLKSRLSAFRNELEIHLVLSIRDNAVSLTAEQAKSFTALQESLKQLVEKPVLCKEDLQAQNAELIRASTAEHEKTRATILAAMSEKEVLDVQDILLHSLKFPQMWDRYQEILEAHIQTFKWIFDDSSIVDRRWSSLVNWLEYGNGVYWVCGKAGSGKSTLMRYMYDNPRTLEHLKNWSGDTDLDTAAFFFWNSGNAEQRSHTGLLRSLLYEILKKKANLLPEIFPEEWSEACSALGQAESSSVRWELVDRKWTLAALKRGFARLTKFETIKSNQCFFIDGLDEYEGDHESMVDFLRTLAISSHIKFCLSSRPWLVFEDAFKLDPGLRLQDLTVNDIKSYVAHELEEHDRMRKLATEEPGHASELVNEIVLKAAGVFLWVKLVVRELLKGLRNRDDISNLRTRLRALPSELEGFYAHMLKQIEPLYRDQAFRAFQIYNIMAEEFNSLCPLELDIAISATFERMMETPFGHMSDDEIRQRCDHVEDYLKSRCAGLLEIHHMSNEHAPEPTNYPCCYLRVNFLHQTVREFLEGKIAKDMMPQGASSHTASEPMAHILMSFVIRLKREVINCRVQPGLLERFEDIFEVLKDALGFATKCDSLGVHYYSILEELNEVGSFWHKEEAKEESKIANCSGHPIARYDHWYDDYIFRREQQGSGFLGVAVRFGLLSYVSNKLESNRDTLFSSRRGSPALLNCALLPSRSDANDPSQFSETNVGMLGLLLKHGASPNTVWKGYTTWQRVLSLVHNFNWDANGRNNYDRGGYLHNWLLAFTMLLQHGASPTTTCLENHPVDAGEVVKLDSHRVADVISDVFGKCFPKETAQLLQMVHGLGKSQTMARADKSPPGYHQHIPRNKRPLDMRETGSRKRQYRN